MTLRLARQLAAGQTHQLTESLAHTQHGRGGCVIGQRSPRRGKIFISWLRRRLMGSWQRNYVMHVP